MRARRLPGAEICAISVHITVAVQRRCARERMRQRDRSVRRVVRDDSDRRARLCRDGHRLRRGPLDPRSRGNSSESGRRGRRGCRVPGSDGATTTSGSGVVVAAVRRGLVGAALGRGRVIVVGVALVLGRRGRAAEVGIRARGDELRGLVPAGRDRRRSQRWPRPPRAHSPTTSAMRRRRLVWVLGLGGNDDDVVALEHFRHFGARGHVDGVAVTILRGRHPCLLVPARPTIIAASWLEKKCLLKSIH